MTTIFPKSNFASALIFILLIAVPFFIALLTVYIYFGIWNDSEACSIMCSLKPPNDHFFKHKNMSDQEHLDIIAKIDKDELLNPSIGALLTHKLKLVCAVALISRDYVLTTERCVKPAHRPTDFKIRLYSNYSNHHGALKKVLQIKLLNRDGTPYYFAALKFEPTPLEEEKLIVPLHMMNSRNTELMNLKLYYYNKDNKLTFFKVNRVPKHCCNHEFNKHQKICTVQSYGRCSYETNAILLSDHYFIGIQFDSDCATKICYHIDTYDRVDPQWSEIRLSVSG